MKARTNTNTSTSARARARLTASASQAAAAAGSCLHLELLVRVRRVVVPLPDACEEGDVDVLERARQLDCAQRVEVALDLRKRGGRERERASQCECDRVWE
eukprot:3167658-Pleurochrysis_carterae.AAC.1